MNNGQIIGGTHQPPRTQVIPAQAIMDQFLGSMLNSMVLAMFIKVFNKKEAENTLIEIFQNEFAQMKPFFDQIASSDIGSSGRIKRELEITFEQFKQNVLSFYNKTEEKE